MLSADIDKLLSLAEAARAKAIAPSSGFPVGAALMAEGGACFTGCNVENPSIMLSICAERVALLKALSEGHRRFRAMALVAGSGDYCFPCGACRQVLFEFAPGLPIYLASSAGVRKFTVEELLPYPFSR